MNLLDPTVIFHILWPEGQKRGRKPFALFLFARWGKVGRVGRVGKGGYWFAQRIPSPNPMRDLFLLIPWRRHWAVVLREPTESKNVTALICAWISFLGPIVYSSHQSTFVFAY